MYITLWSGHTGRAGQACRNSAAPQYTQRHRRRRRRWRGRKESVRLCIIDGAAVGAACWHSFGWWVIVLVIGGCGHHGLMSSVDSGATLLIGSHVVLGFQFWGMCTMEIITYPLSKIQKSFRTNRSGSALCSIDVPAPVFHPAVNVTSCSYTICKYKHETEAVIWVSECIYIPSTCGFQFLFAFVSVRKTIPVPMSVHVFVSVGCIRSDLFRLYIISYLQMYPCWFRLFFVFCVDILRRWIV